MGFWSSLFYTERQMNRDLIAIGKKPRGTVKTVRRQIDGVDDYHVNYYNDCVRCYDRSFKTYAEAAEYAAPRNRLHTNGYAWDVVIPIPPKV